MPIAFAAFVRKHLMRTVCSSTPTFYACAQCLLSEYEDLGTTKWSYELRTARIYSSHFMVLAPIVRFNPRLRDKLLACDEPEAAALYIELGGDETAISCLLFATDMGSHNWLRVYIELRREFVQQEFDTCRANHEADIDADEPFEDILDPTVRTMLEAAGLL